ncbi:unnamed protein product [Ilex paraguariensis]|uniref:Uncharacterized protein n=1 Tax=Ilex paraguariensis TaxID=185542 RepID=A0ABC8USH1_9AQUA
MAGSWQPTVPSWEKMFCKLGGLPQWEKIVETKKFMHLFENVVKWNDSAGEEAFNNAKSRFFARTHGLPCDISLPDPDIYIDEIDWDSKIDPELLLDLEREPVIPDADEKDEHVVIFGSSLLANQGFSTTGWGEVEEELKRANKSSLCNNDNPWEGNCSQNNTPVKVNGWGDGWDNSWGWNQHENNNYESKVVNDTNTWDVNNWKSGNTDRYMSRYKTSRFHSNDYQGINVWRNGKGRERRNLFGEQPTADKRSSSRQWDLNNSGLVSHHELGEGGQAWT